MRDTSLDAMLIEFAKEKKPEDRGLLETLLALDVPVERALDLVVGETTRAANGSLAQMAWFIRESRMNQFEEGSEVYRRLGMIADMLDPSGADSWEFLPPVEPGSDRSQRKTATEQQSSAVE